MRESEIYDKYKIDPLTLLQLRHKLKGNVVKGQGRILYNLTDEDKELLLCARVDPYTFRHKYTSFAPFHNFMVFLVLTQDATTIYNEFKRRKIVVSNRIKPTIDTYRAIIINSLPAPIRGWIKSGQDIPAQDEYLIRSTLRVLGLEKYYDDPDRLFQANMISYNEDDKDIIEVFLTTKGSIADIKDITNKLNMNNVTMDMLADYKELIYNVDYMTVDHWSNYLLTQTLPNARFKRQAYGMNLPDYLKQIGMFEALQINDFLSSALSESMRTYHDAQDMQTVEGLRMAESALKNVLLIKDNIPERDELIEEFKSRLDKRMRIRQEDPSSANLVLRSSLKEEII